MRAALAAIYRSVSAMLADSGLDHAEAAAGCARCQACSGLSAWERVFEKEANGGHFQLGTVHAS